MPGLSARLSELCATARVSCARWFMSARVPWAFVRDGSCLPAFRVRLFMTAHQLPANRAELPASVRGVPPTVRVPAGTKTYFSRMVRPARACHPRHGLPDDVVGAHWHERDTIATRLPSGGARNGPRGSSHGSEALARGDPYRFRSMTHTHYRTHGNRHLYRHGHAGNRRLISGISQPSHNFCY